MNLIAKIKRLELEAAERDKRIEALESQVRDTSWALRDARDALDEAARAVAANAQAPKKRKPRAKTSTTE